MQLIAVLCLAAVAHAASLRRQETLTDVERAKSTERGKAVSFAEAQSNSSSDEGDALETGEDFFRGGGLGINSRGQDGYGVSRAPNKTMLRGRHGDGFQQGAGSSSAVNNRVSLCLNGDDCDDKKEPARPERKEDQADDQGGGGGGGGGGDGGDPQPEEEEEAETTPDPADMLTKNCVHWSRDDQCNKNPAYMLQKCSKQCDNWCDETACDSRILDHWRKCLDYARGGACYSHTGYMKTACNAFCPKHTYPPNGFDKHGGPSLHYGGNPLQVPVQEPARVLPGVQVNPGWNQSNPVWSSQFGAEADPTEITDAMAAGSGASGVTASGVPPVTGGVSGAPGSGEGSGMRVTLPTATPTSQIPAGPPQTNGSSVLPPDQPGGGGVSYAAGLPMTPSEAKLYQSPPGAPPKQPMPPPQPPVQGMPPAPPQLPGQLPQLPGQSASAARSPAATGAAAPASEFRLTSTPRAPASSGRPNVEGRRARIVALLADSRTINFTMDIALNVADLSSVQEIINHPNSPSRHSLEAALRGMLAARLVERDTGLQVIAKNLYVLNMSMRRLVHSSTSAVPSVLHVRVAILAPLIKAGILGKDALTLLGRRIGKKLLEDAFKVAGTPVRITNYYVGL